MAARIYSQQLDRTHERRIERAGGSSEAAEHEIAELVDKGSVTIRTEHVDERL